MKRVFPKRWKKPYNTTLIFPNAFRGSFIEQEMAGAYFKLFGFNEVGEHEGLENAYPKLINRNTYQKLKHS